MEDGNPTDTAQRNPFRRDQLRPSFTPQHWRTVLTITVTIDIQGDAQGASWSVVANQPAEEAIRFTFNPSGLANVTKLKALAAAFLTACDEAQLDNPAAGREMAVAKTNMQTASMWAVLGATKGL